MRASRFNADVAAGALTGGTLLPVVGVRGTFPVGGVLTLGAPPVLTWPAHTRAEEVASLTARRNPRIGLQ